MNLIEAEKLLRSSKNQDEAMVNAAQVGHFLFKDNARIGVRILKRTGLLEKVQKIARESDDLEVYERDGVPFIKRGGTDIAPLNIMPIEYYLDEMLNLKGARFYHVYKCLLSSPDIVAAMAISDSINER